MWLYFQYLGVAEKRDSQKNRWYPYEVSRLKRTEHSIWSATRSEQPAHPGCWCKTTPLPEQASSQPIQAVGVREYPHRDRGCVRRATEGDAQHAGIPMTLVTHAAPSPSPCAAAGKHATAVSTLCTNSITPYVRLPYDTPGNSLLSVINRYRTVSNIRIVCIQYWCKNGLYISVHSGCTQDSTFPGENLRAGCSRKDGLRRHTQTKTLALGKKKVVEMFPWTRRKAFALYTLSRK